MIRAAASSEPGFRLARLSSHTGAPTQSNTTSTPRPPVSSLTAPLNFGVVFSDSFSASDRVPVGCVCRGLRNHELRFGQRSEASATRDQLVE